MGPGEVIALVVWLAAQDAAPVAAPAPPPTAPPPTAPSPTAPSPTAPSPTAPSPTAPSPTAPSPTAPMRVPIDAVAAVVDRKVITVTEVEAEARLALLEKMGVAGADAVVDGRFLRTMLDHVVVQELLLVEARRAQRSTIKEGAVEARVQALHALFPSAQAAQEFMARYGIDDELLRARARRDLLDQALVSEVLGRAGQPSDDEVRRTAGAADAARLEVVRAELLRVRREKAFTELVARLRAELDVRLVATFE